jgi:transposase InsO family protein
MTLDRLWHLRLGHVGQKGLRELCMAGAVKGVPTDQLIAAIHSTNAAVAAGASRVCDGCALGKAHRHAIRSWRDPDGKAKSPLAVVHLDLKGPVTIGEVETDQQLIRASLDGSEALWLSVIVDEYTRRVWVALLRSKDEAADHIKTWTARVERATGLKVKEFHSDGGGEYRSLADFFRQNGIRHSTTQPATPQQNGIAERLNRTLFDMAVAMMQHARLSPVFWEEAILAATYVRNRCLTTGTSEHHPSATPEELFSGIKPDLSKVIVFGSDGYVHVPEIRRLGEHALDAKAD